MDKTFAMIVGGILLSFAVLAGIAVTNPAFAYNSGENQCMKPDYMGMLKQLNLSEDQNSKIWTLMQDFKNDMKPQRQSLTETRNYVAVAMSSDKFSEAETRSLLRNALMSKEELIISRIKMMNEIKKVMTPDQIEKLKKLQKEYLAKNH